MTVRATDQIIEFGYTVSDGDWTMAMSSFKVKIADDGPIAEDDKDMVVEGGMTIGNVIDGIDDDTDPNNIGVQVADTPGADGPVKILSRQRSDRWR